MMKFTINTVATSGARLGLLSDLVRIPDAVLETPYLLLHTRVRHFQIIQLCLEVNISILYRVPLFLI